MAPALTSVVALDPYVVRVGTKRKPKPKPATTTTTTATTTTATKPAKGGPVARRAVLP